ncbi:hypothetical protein [Melaminivora sp.]|uniref:hypothetical protein n=1 Tax=Melaminivora sp. TaxID=1933032 RepID=UPI0028A7E04A|nr:hypothetical protein [Melaminivora sp.]
MPNKKFRFLSLDEFETSMTPTKKTRLAKAIGRWYSVGRGASNLALAMSQVPESKNEVVVRGETLAQVLWQGEQWAVTEYGIEARDGTYQIEAKLLSERNGDHTLMHHMAEKPWVDMRDFALAFAIACAVFEVPFDKGVA